MVIMLMSKVFRLCGIREECKGSRNGVLSFNLNIILNLVEKLWGGILCIRIRLFFRV